MLVVRRVYLRIVHSSERPSRSQTSSDCGSAQWNPLSEEPKPPAVAVSGRYRRYLLTIPVEWLMILAALVEAARLPAGARGLGWVGSRLAGPARGCVRRPTRCRLCRCCPETDAERRSDSDAARQYRCPHHALELHSITSISLSYGVVRHATTVRVEDWSALSSS